MTRERREIKRTYRMNRTLRDGRRVTISKPFLDMSASDIGQALAPLLSRRDKLDLEIAILSNTLEYLHKHKLTHVRQITDEAKE